MMCHIETEDFMTITSKTWGAIGAIAGVIGVIWAIYTYMDGGSGTKVEAGSNSNIAIGNNNQQTTGD